MDPAVVVRFGLGLLLLIAGAEALVRGASRLARAAGISPLVIGLTVVAFGTSAPELAVTVRSAMAGAAGADLALGNVVGSNIFNVLFILGLSALVAPLAVSRQLVRFDVPLMIAVSLICWGMAADGRVSRWEGLSLFAGIVLYTAWAIYDGRRQARLEAQSVPDPGGNAKGGIAGASVLVLAGLATLVVGSRWLVDGAVRMAAALGVSELVVSLTIVAAGTSLPEVATSVLASVRGERDLAVGNVVGSNLFNLLSVLGLGALLAPHGVRVSPAALAFDLPVMTATAVICLPIFFTGYRIARPEGSLFLLYYAAYATYLVFAATGHEQLGILRAALLWVVVPVTVLTLGFTVARQLQERSRGGAPR